MTPADIATGEQSEDCIALINKWAEARLSEGGALVAYEYHPDDSRWLVRLAGEEKEFVTVWLTIRQRTLRHEAQMMPFPETNVQSVFEYLLRKNSDLYQMRLSLGPEDAVYLTGEIPVSDVDEDELDRVIGSSLHYVDDLFPTAMSIGFAGLYRRRGGNLRR